MQLHLSRPDITDKEIQIINEVIRSPILALGPKMIEFEKAIADLYRC
jgi:perosamine synthetase